MILKDYYKILNLDGPKVSAEKIKLAYREQAKKYHPDRNSQGQRNTEERFKDINEAYRVLSNETAKRKYDRVWNSKIKRRTVNTQTKPKEKEPLQKELFNMFFGNTDEVQNEDLLKIKAGNKKAIKGQNIETSINVSIEDGFYGKGKSICLKDEKGKTKTFSFKVPEGIKNEGTVRLSGLGKKSKNGGENGDLLIKVNIDNSENLKLMGDDLYTNLFLTPWDAALGTKVDVNGIDEKISIKIPKGVQYGEKIEIKGKGYKKTDGTRGNLVVNTQIVIPKQLNEEEKEIIEKLKNISKFDPNKK